MDSAWFRWQWGVCENKRFRNRESSCRLPLCMLFHSRFSLIFALVCSNCTACKKRAESPQSDTRDKSEWDRSATTKNGSYQGFRLTGRHSIHYHQSHTPNTLQFSLVLPHEALKWIGNPQKIILRTRLLWTSRSLQHYRARLLSHHQTIKPLRRYLNKPCMESPTIPSVYLWTTAYATDLVPQDRVRHIKVDGNRLCG